MTLSKETETGLWILTFDDLLPSLAYTLSCKLTNTTDSLFQASFQGPFDLHQFPVSNALSYVHPNCGKLALIPQALLDQLAGLQSSNGSSKLQGISKFLCQLDTPLLLRLGPHETSIKMGDFRGNLMSLSFADKVILLQKSTNKEFPFIELIISTEGGSTQHYQKRGQRFLSLSLYIDTVLIFAPIPSSLLTLNNPGSTNFLRASVRCIEGYFKRKKHSLLSSFSITSSLIQIDNLAQLSLSTFDFPVILRFVLSHSMIEKSSSIFSCSGRICQASSGGFLLDRFDLRLPSMEVYLEDSILYATISWVRDLRDAWSAVGDKKQSPMFTVVSFRSFEVHPVSLQLALKAKVGMHISCKTTQFRLKSFALSEAVLQPKTLLAQLSTHYISQILIRAGLVLGSLELIGNPARLVASFAQGISDLVHFVDSERIATREQLGLLRGLARGLLSLVKHTTG